MDTLHEKGYLQIKNWIDTSEAHTLLVACAPIVSKASHIFNNNPTQKEDKKRVQAILPRGISKSLQKFIHKLFPEKQINDFVILKSKAGCQQQAAHTDYVPTQEILYATDDEMPLLFLIALEENTKLCVWPRSHTLIQGARRRPIKCEEVHMNAGDALVFRGDLVHAGASYDTDNVRIHVYLDTADIPRKKNMTYSIHKHAPVEIQEKIIE